MIGPTINNQKSRIKNASGFTLLEASVAGVLLVVLMVIAAQLIGWVLSERRASERRHWATVEAENVMERLSSVPWNELTSVRAAAERLSPQAGTVLPAGELKTKIADEPDSPDAKRIDIEVRWERRPHEQAAPVRLTAWVYRRGEQNQ